MDRGTDQYTGRATRVRDVIDVGDAIETFIPFAKRLGWITRRLTGFVTSTVGAIAISLLAVPKSSPMKEVAPISVDWSGTGEHHRLPYSHDVEADQYPR